MIVYFLSFAGIAICIFMLWAVHWAGREEEKERNAFFGVWNRKRYRDNVRYYAYLRRRRERECKKLLDPEYI